MQQGQMDAVYTQLSAAADALKSEMDNTGDFDVLDKIQAQYDVVIACMARAQQAKAAADQAVFEQSVTALKAQAAALDGAEARIRCMIADAEKATRIIDCITRALTLLA